MSNPRKAAQLARLIAKQPGPVSAATVAEMLGCDNASAGGYLTTASNRGWVVKVSARKWGAGPERPPAQAAERAKATRRRVSRARRELSALMREVPSPRDPADSRAARLRRAA